MRGSIRSGGAPKREKDQKPSSLPPISRTRDQKAAAERKFNFPFSSKGGRLVEEEELERAKRMVLSLSIS